MEERHMNANKITADTHHAVAQLVNEKLFSDGQNARSIFTRLLSAYPENIQDLLPWLIPALRSAADPDRSLVHFERLVDAFGVSVFADLQENPRLVEILVTLFSASPFLTEILLGTPDAIRLVGERSRLTERKTVDQYHSEGQAAWQSKKDYLDRLNALRRYQRRQLLRIGVSDFLDLFDLRAVFSQLSRMAIGMTRACLALAAEETGVSAANFTVLAMGKLGARELNYSSDIDLLFIAKQSSDNNLKLAKSLIDILSKSTGEGFLYRVDMRLRPWGHDGPLVTTLEGYLRYYKESALLWEKQAFLKARPIAGNLAFGEELRKEVEPLLFSIPSDEVRAGIFSMKQRTEEFLLEKGRKWGEVKLGAGSIRDVEFVVQSLQLTHSSIRTRSTLKAIPLLRDARLITPEEARILTDGYIFLRTIEHYLQITDYQQTYTLPSDEHSLALLARRLGFEGHGAGDRFIQAYERHSLALRTIFLKYVGGQPVALIVLAPEIAIKVQQHVARMDASYATTFSPDEIAHHTRLTELLSSDKPVIVEPQPVDDNRWRITIVGYDYLGVLSIICGLMYLYGLDILESQVFTYEANHNVGGDQGLKKIVDAFIVRSVKEESIQPELWKSYAEDLKELITKIKTGRRREAQGDLVKRVGATFHEAPTEGMPLYPVEIEIDNDADDKYTLLRISAPDTAGFLYEFSNALALSHINIVRMLVQSVGSRASDILYVTNDKGEKIVTPEKQ
ncbi:glutamine synthetase adenylyltransferase, partial [bacterium]|nr:glutamine synthetase adenylyltransferase [bacterium]